jgi:hypothetical protein
VDSINYKKDWRLTYHNNQEIYERIDQRIYERSHYLKSNYQFVSLQIE